MPGSVTSSDVSGSIGRRFVSCDADAVRIVRGVVVAETGGAVQRERRADREVETREAGRAVGVGRLHVGAAAGVAVPRRYVGMPYSVASLPTLTSYGLTTPRSPKYSCFAYSSASPIVIVPLSRCAKSWFRRSEYATAAVSPRPKPVLPMNSIAPPSIVRLRPVEREVGRLVAREVLELVEEREAGVTAHREDDSPEHGVRPACRDVGRREEIRRRLVVERVPLRGQRAVLVVVRVQRVDQRRGADREERVPQVVGRPRRR